MVSRSSPIGSSELAVIAPGCAARRRELGTAGSRATHDSPSPPLPRALNLSRRSSTGQTVAYAYFRPDENEAR